MEKIRNKQVCDHEVVGRLCSMLYTLDLYSFQFEPLLLADSKRFFHQEGTQLVADLDTAQFFLLVESTKT